MAAEGTVRSAFRLTCSALSMNWRMGMVVEERLTLARRLPTRTGSNASSTSSSSATSTASLAARSALPDAHSNALSQRRHTNRARDSKYKLERRLEALLQAQQRA